MTLTLTEHQVELIRKSIQHCLEICHNGGVKNGCSDCMELEEVLKKLAP